MSRDYNKLLVKSIGKKVNEFVREAMLRIKNEWSRYNLDELGKAEITSMVDRDLTGTITAELIAEGQKAWILEFGRGSQMANSFENPFLDEYIKDKNFNKSRLDNNFAITGRKKGTYYDLDGNQHTSTGTKEGQNLEEWYHDKAGYKYLPIPPLRVIQTVLYGDGDSGLIAEFRESIAECVFDVYAQMLNEYAEKEIKIRL